MYVFVMYYIIAKSRNDKGPNISYCDKSGYVVDVFFAVVVALVVTCLSYFGSFEMV